MIIKMPRGTDDAELQSLSKQAAMYFALPEDDGPLLIKPVVEDEAESIQ